MTSVPNEKDPVQGTGQLHAPDTTDAPTSRREEDQPPRQTQSSPAAIVHHENKSRNQLLSKNIFRPIALALIGGILALVALILYPSPDELSTPPYSSLDVTSSFPLGIIGYEVAQVSPSIAMIRIQLLLPTGTTHQPPKSDDVHLSLFPPPGIAFQTCPPGPCAFIRDENNYVGTASLQFNREFNIGGNPTGTAIATFYVKAHDFGYISNSVNASAAIPAVNYSGPGSPLLESVYYDATSVTNYDWSAFPPNDANGTKALWDEPLVSGAAPGRVAVGIDHANETKDSNKIFIAGALIGLAGGAVLSAVQEALHAND